MQLKKSTNRSTTSSSGAPSVIEGTLIGGGKAAAWWSRGSAVSCHGGYGDAVTHGCPYAVWLHGWVGAA